MGSHAALISELEAAKEGSRALSDEVLTACDAWERTAVGEIFPDPTGNLQDAVDLVPEGWGGCRVIEERTGRGRAFIGPAGAAPSGQAWAGYEVKNGEPINIATPALALSIAILKAMETADG